MIFGSGYYWHYSLVFLYGLIALLAQVLLLREATILFHGNELVIGILFFVWFLGGALGTAKPLNEKYVKNQKLPTLFLVLMTVVLFSLLVITRIAFSFFQDEADLSLIHIFSLSTALLLPISYVSGLCFKMLSSVAISDGVSLSRIYAVESFAFAAAGLIYSFAFVEKVKSLQISWLLIVLAVSSLVICLARKKIHLVYLVFLLILLWFSAPLFEKADRLTTDFQWRKTGETVSSQESRYGAINISQNAGLKTVYYNGRPIGNYPATEASLEIGNLARAVVRKPKKILVLGFGTWGVLQELSKAFPRSIVNVEKDPILVKNTIEALPESDKKGMSRVEFIHADPFSWVRSSRDSYDLIILPILNMATLADARYYSSLFFINLSRLLKKNGKIICALEYSEKFPTHDGMANIAHIGSVIKRHLGFVHFVPVQNFYWIASNNQFVLSLKQISPQLGKISRTTPWFNRAYLSHYLDPKRYEVFRSILERFPAKGSLRFDYGERLYRNAFVDWVRKGGYFFSVVFFLVLFVSTLIVLKLYIGYRLKQFLAWQSITVLFIGFAAVVGELLVLNLYQMIFGHVYRAYAIMVGIFMLGMSFGSTRLPHKDAIASSKLYLVPFIIAIWLLLINLSYFTSTWFVQYPDWFSFWFSLLMVAGGFCVGWSFALLSKNNNLTVYSFDLMGSALGALVGAPVLIPFFGHTYTIIAVAVTGLVISGAGYVAKKIA